MAARISKADFTEKVLNSQIPVIVDFYSDSCMPCKQLTPVLGDIEDENEDKLAVYKVNVNYEEDLISEYQIMSAPTLILFHNGEKISTKRGFVTKEELQSWIDTNIHS